MRYAVFSGKEMAIAIFGIIGNQQNRKVT